MWDTPTVRMFRTMSGSTMQSEAQIRAVLAHIRKERGLSLQQQANELGVPLTTLHGFTQGTRPVIGQRLRLALVRTYPMVMIPLLSAWATGIDVTSDQAEVGESATVPTAP
jgi:transcriptional regulator with XRE-family HTH domain